MTQNIAASVRQRLLNLARVQARPFGELLQHFALERFLYRLGISAYRNQFVLKGALMLKVWNAPASRPTRDIDLLGQTDNTVEHITTVIQAVCQESAPEDGILFDVGSVVAERIAEAASYPGI